MNLMRLGTPVAKENYAINLVIYIAITLVICSLTTLFIKEKIRWFKGVFIGAISSAILNGLVMIFFYFLMLYCLK